MLMDHLTKHKRPPMNEGQIKAITNTRIRDLYNTCGNHTIRLDKVEKKIASFEKQCSESRADRQELHKKVEKLYSTQIDQGLAINSIHTTMDSFIKKHEEDAPKAIKAMKRIWYGQIGTVIIVVGFIIGFIAWQTKRIIELQDNNIQLLHETIKKEQEKKNEDKL